MAGPASRRNFDRGEHNSIIMVINEERYSAHVEQLTAACGWKDGRLAERAG